MKKLSILFTILLGLLIFISDASMSRASGTVYLYQDFDNVIFPPAGWSVNTSGYPWIISTRTSGYGIGKSCACADFCNVASGSFDLVTYTLPPTTAGDSLSFDHAYTCASTENDQLVIYYSTNGGSAWTILVTLNGGPSGPLTTAPPTVLPFVPNPSQWATKRYSLPVGTNMLKFTGISAYGNFLYVDNIRVGAAYANDVGVNSIFAPKWAITPGAYTPTVLVRNYGTTTQSFQVTLTINPGNYSSPQSVTNLAPGQTQQLTFSNFNFSQNGVYTLKAYSTLASDQNRSNDTITNPIVVSPAPRSVLLEFCTGTWCQWCPCGDRAADTLEAYYPNTVILAYHGPTGYPDPYLNFNGNGIISMLGLSGYPSGPVDRRGTSLALSWGAFYSDAEYRYSQSPVSTVNIAITNLSYNTSTRVLSVNLSATALTTLNGQYKINYVITEDNLVYNQTGNGNCPGSSNWIHNWVTRNMVNGAAGDNVNSGTWNNNQTYNLSFNTTLDGSWISGNCRLNIFVYNGTNGTSNSSEIQGSFKRDIDITGISKQGTTIPAQYELSQNFPNPFNPTTNIHIAIPKGESVSFKIYDVTGRLVETYLDGFVKAGNYNIEVDASKYASGVYFYTLYTNDFVQTKKMILLK
jgi:hypothetical protein